jgi:hypothetical protein
LTDFFSKDRVPGRAAKWPRPFSQAFKLGENRNADFGLRRNFGEARTLYHEDKNDPGRAPFGCLMFISEKVVFRTFSRLCARQNFAKYPYNSADNFVKTEFRWTETTGYPRDPRSPSRAETEPLGVLETQRSFPSFSRASQALWLLQTCLRLLSSLLPPSASGTRWSISIR